jgi:hypothetical protein
MCVVSCYQKVSLVGQFWGHEVIRAHCTSSSSWVPLSLLLFLLAFLPINLLLGLSAHPQHPVCQCLLLLLAFLPINLLLHLSAHLLQPGCHCLLLLLLAFLLSNLSFQEEISGTLVYCQDFGSCTVSLSQTGHTVNNPQYNLFIHFKVFLKKWVVQEVLVCSMNSMYLLFSTAKLLLYPLLISLLCVLHCSIVRSTHQSKLVLLTSWFTSVDLHYIYPVVASVLHKYKYSILYNFPHITGSESETAPLQDHGII